MTAIEILHALATGYVAIWALYLLLLPLLAIRWRARVRVMKKLSDTEWPTIAIIVPARNAARVIARCLHSLRACTYQIEKVHIYVIADHCTDDTAERARSPDVTVLVRNEGPKGKTYALAWAFGELTKRGAISDLYLIVDATAQIKVSFLSALAEHWWRGENIITSHAVLSSENQKWFAQCLGLMLVHRSLQNWARERLGLSAMLSGLGMAYSRNYIQKVGWRLALPTGLRAAHPTEDWRHGVQAVGQGYRVAFAEKALIATPLRDSLLGATQQGARWERGRMINAGTHALRLLLQGLQQRKLGKVCAALDAIQPPVAILAALSLWVMILPMLAPSTGLSGVLGFVPCILVGLYGLAVVGQGQRNGIKVTTVIWAPLYIAWRCVSFVFSWGFLDRIDLGGRQKDDAS
jgi:cellulose synthase/poly-beta-1,6-N-acetylglucosamine synthase-like glycosyltransferase